MEQFKTETPQETPETQPENGTTQGTPSTEEQLRKELEAKEASAKHFQALFDKERAKNKKEEKKSIESKYGLDAYDKADDSELKEVLTYFKDMKENQALDSFASANGIDAETKTKIKDVTKRYPGMSFDEAVVLAKGNAIADEAAAKARAEEEVKRVAASKSFTNSAPTANEEQQKINGLTESQLNVIRKTGLTPEQYVKNLK